jgi:hypothetical protein
MFKNRFSLRNLVTTVACLAVVMFSGCDPEEDKSSEKAITAFGFTTSAAVGVIDEAAKTIAVDVPAGTDVSALAPVIVLSSPLATVNPANGAAQDFTKPAIYTVTAEDGSTAIYTVTVTAPPVINGSEAELNGHYYLRVDAGMTWTEAKAICESRGGHLVTVTSQAEQNLVQALIKDGTQNQYWIGAYADENRVWHWVTNETWSYTNWGHGGTNDWLGKEDYVQMYRIANKYWHGSGTNELGIWNDMSNDNTTSEGEKDVFAVSLIGYVIEYDNGKPASNHRYEVIEQSMTWTAAKAHCESLGGHLATISSKEEQDIVYNLIKDGAKNQYWLGAYADENRAWHWVTDEAWSYTNWAHSGPNNWLGKENYVQMYRLPNKYWNGSIDENDKGMWNDISIDNTIAGEEDFFSLEHIGIICEYVK